MQTSGMTFGLLSRLSLR
uniref:Uncharacterized protein n=1 Tax=Rhizophora mucronata TaxID=61149 RepID=A0A2P2QTS3_RHIMU